MVLWLLRRRLPFPDRRLLLPPQELGAPFADFGDFRTMPPIAQPYLVPKELVDLGDELNMPGQSTCQNNLTTRPRGVLIPEDLWVPLEKWLIPIISS